MNRKLKPHKHFMQHGRRGFTLLEMMIVLALIAILSSIAAPSLTRMRNRSVSRGFANSVADQLRIARTQAKTQGQPILVTITPGDPNTPNDVGTITLQRGKPYCRDSSTSPGIGSLCPDNMPPQPPVSCAELTALSAGNRELFTTETLPITAQGAISPDNYIVGSSAQANATSPTTFCFSPDGRVLGNTGDLVTTTANLCSGEYFVILTASKDQRARTYKAGTSLRDLGFQCPRNGDAAEINAARDEANLYRIVLPYDGSIRVTR